MKFRSKGQKRSYEELQHLIATYGNHKVDVVDNILDMAYFEEFIPQLAGAQQKLGLFYETKANLSKRHLAVLASAGIKAIQPGIESLSDDALTLMRKGVKAIHNVQLLKWAKLYGIEPVWNFLWGFPDENPEEYECVANIVPLLHHLRPPQGGSRLRLDRFSPLYEDRAKFDLRNVAPFPAYHHVYDVPAEALFDLAYYFDFDYPDGRDPNFYTRGLRTSLMLWQEQYAVSELLLLEFDDATMIIDTRGASNLGGVYALGSVETELLRCADKAIAYDSLISRVVEIAGRAEDIVADALTNLQRRGLVLKLSGLILALPVNMNEFSPSGRSLDKVGEAISNAASRAADGQTLVIPRV